MIEASFQGITASIEEIIGDITSLPRHLAPRYFGVDEGVRKPGDVVADSDRFARFVREETTGFFLCGDSATFSVIKRYDGTFSVDVDDLNEVDALLIVDVLGASNVTFGFACCTGERHHRNQLSKKTPGGSETNWVGRDWRKYVPGLYWVTILSDDLIREHGVPRNDLMAPALTMKMLSNINMLLKFFDKPERWIEYAPQLDDVCEKTTGVFSKRRVEPSYMAAKDFLESMAVLHDFR